MMELLQEIPLILPPILATVEIIILLSRQHGFVMDVLNMVRLQVILF